MPSGITAIMPNTMAGITSETSIKRGVTASLVALVLAVAVLVAMARVNPYTTDMDYDSGVFAYVASQLAHGLTPYVDAWDQKPPAVYFIDALAILVGGHTRWAIWGVESLCIFAAAVAGFWTLRKALGLGPALFGSLTWLWGFQHVLGGGNYTEEYSLVFSFAGLGLFLLILERPQSLLLHAALGITFGCSFLTRPNNAGVQTSILITELLLMLLQEHRRSSLKGLLFTAAGFAVPLAAVLAYFASRNAVQPFLQGAFGYNYYYMLVGDSGGHFSPLHTLRMGVQNLGPASVIGLGGVVLAAAMLAHQAMRRDIRPLTLWLCVDFGIELIFSSLTGNNYGHYFIIWLPWMAFASANLVATVLPRGSTWAERHAAPVLLGATALVAAVGWGALRGYDPNVAVRSFDRSQLEAQDALVEYIVTQTRPDDTVLVWSAGTAINFLSGRASPTAYFLYSNFVPSPFTARMSWEFNRQLRAHPPELIVDRGYRGSEALSTPHSKVWSKGGNWVQPYMQDFLDFVHQNYRPEAVVGNMLIYRRATR